MQIYNFQEEFERAFRDGITYGDIFMHLPYLNQMGKQCESITEFGVRGGGSTRAFLNTNAKLRSYDLEIIPPIEELFLSARHQDKDVQCITGNSLLVDIEQTDLLFIDSLHTYDQLREELFKHHSKVNKFIIMHDVYIFGLVAEWDYSDQLGLLPAVFEFLIAHPEWKVNYYTVICNGLLTLAR